MSWNYTVLQTCRWRRQKYKSVLEVYAYGTKYFGAQQGFPARRFICKFAAVVWYKRVGLAECVFCLIMQVGKIFTQFCLSSREDHPLAIMTRIKRDLAKHLFIKLHSCFSARSGFLARALLPEEYSSQEASFASVGFRGIAYVPSGCCLHYLLTLCNGSPLCKTKLATECVTVRVIC